MSFVPCGIREIELSRPLSGVEATDECAAVRLVFTLRGTPLAHETLAADHLPLTAAAVASLASRVVAPTIASALVGADFPEVAEGADLKRPRAATVGDFDRLESIGRPLAAMTSHLATAGDASMVSVIVCTRDRPHDLASCLDALLRSIRKPGEIVVVDNAPDRGDTRDIVRARPAVRYVAEPRAGLSHARNAGIANSSGAIIAFTDDDVLVNPDWTARLAAAFTQERVMAVTGLVLPAELRSEAQWIFEHHFGGFPKGYRELRFDERYFAKCRPRGASVWRIGAGANMAFRRLVFERLGAFDTRLGAGASGCSEDSEMWYRVLSAGGICRYDPTLVVHHYHRTTLDALSRQMHDYMRGHVTALLVQLQRHHHGGNLFRLLVSLPWHFLKLGVLEVLHGFRRHRTLWPELRGAVAGVVYFLRHPRRQRRPLESGS